jgi:hypothetical protein
MEAKGETGHVRLSGADRRQARRSDGNDLSKTASHPGSDRAQQYIQVSHNFVPGAFTQAVGREIKGAPCKVWVPVSGASRPRQK